ncbi:MAG: septal ring lytic transglycosylase RlpA family protein [Nitrospiraceae bacterium]|nr:septal ring lytic transglycosylase RlpA family protein [Nitrospiraceae bacterium]
MVTILHTRSFRKSAIAALPLAGCLLLGACSSIQKGEIPLDMGIRDRGVASWYGKEFHGKQAANGEIFNMMTFTAAHRKLPLGTVVRVLNLSNGKTVKVRINDRGPYIEGRMLDLSYAAARELGMVEVGIAPVQIEVVGDHGPVMPIPASMIPSVAGTILRTDSASPGSYSRRSSGYHSPVVQIREMPKEALYVRRERRIGSMLAADHTAHNTVPVLVLS